MAILTVQDLAIAGTTPSMVAVAAGGDEFANDGKTVIEVVNSHVGNSYTLTFTTPATIKGVAIADPTGTVGAGVGTRKLFGPFPTSIFNNANGRVAVGYTGAQPATDLTIAVLRLP